MQERSVTIAGENHQLDLPYFVLALKPNRAEGTYPLPEAQLDRFMFAIRVPFF
jgi:MoxR-like ATPase